MVGAVLEGANLTECYESLLRDHPDWSDAKRGAIRDLAWGCLRDYGRGDRVLAELLHKPLPPALHGLLLIALQRLETRPEQAHTVVDQAVDATSALAPGLRGVVNAVLRNALRRQTEFAALLEADPAARWRHPAWWIARLQAEQPEHWQTMLAAGNLHPPMSLRLNRRRADPADLAARLGAAGIDFERLPWGAWHLAQPLPVARLPGFAEGELSVQDAGAQLAALLLAPRAGERVLDACAAPGGKSAHLLELADIRLTALELDARRARRIDDNLARLGLQAEVKVADCCRIDDWWDGQPFDAILADVPCSASGVARRHPDIKWLRREADLASFAATQASILEALWPTLKAGGRLLYATCSLFDAENGAQVDAFLRRHADARPLPISLVGLPAAADGRLQLRPNAAHDGFFYALLQKA